MAEGGFACARDLRSFTDPDAAMLCDSRDRSPREPSGP
jgi:hypothetical protein